MNRFSKSAKVGKQAASFVRRRRLASWTPRNSHFKAGRVLARSAGVRDLNSLLIPSVRQAQEH